MERLNETGARATVLAAFEGNAEAMKGLRDCTDGILAAADLIAASLAEDRTLLVCGNGGSAADAQHIAAEFVGRFLKDRAPYPALALHTNTSALTAIANDFGFEQAFARQVFAHGRPGGVLLAISTSGGSPNVLRAIEAAREVGMSVVGFTGGDGGAMAAGMCDVCLVVPSDSTPRIQEAHIFAGHVLSGLVEDALC
jgi:D-sedoheptulose 7-phosphate isomerase